MTRLKSGIRTVLAITALGLGGFAAAQTGSGDGERASTPPGTARDGSHPADGAIKGGAILPGESGGIPDGRSAAGGASAPPERAVQRAAERCYELKGTLREQCLRDTRKAQESPQITTPPERR